MERKNIDPLLGSMAININNSLNEDEKVTAIFTLVIINDEDAQCNFGGEDENVLDLIKYIKSKIFIKKHLPSVINETLQEIKTTYKVVGTEHD